jgi:death-on-curing protein
MEFLCKRDVLNIHEKLVEDALNSDDPISPPGIKSEHLLESAISRQTVGFGGKLKYDDPLSNAASLCYGICCNHPLHNGNKRTALVSLMCHLDKNGFTFSDRADQDSLYSFMVKVAGHKIAPKKKLVRTTDQSDLEVSEMTSWIRKRTRKVQSGERSISYTEFEKILRQHDVFFENHRNNYVDLVKYVKVKKKKGWFGSEEVTEPTKVANIPYWPGRTVGKNLVKSVRKQAGLTNKDGIDSSLFYGNEMLPDDFIQKNKKVLSKLAKT